MHMLDVSIKLA